MDMESAKGEVAELEEKVRKGGREGVRGSRAET